MFERRWRDLVRLAVVGALADDQERVRLVERPRVVAIERTPRAGDLARDPVGEAAETRPFRFDGDVAERDLAVAFGGDVRYETTADDLVIRRVEHREQLIDRLADGVVVRVEVVSLVVVAGIPQRAIAASRKSKM